MKSTGVVRKIDGLGRVVLPKELREMLNLSQGDPMEIFVEEDKIILKKYQHHKTCIITEEVSSDNLVLGNGKLVLSPKGLEILSKELQDMYVKI